jgi:hypothetical protein
VGFFLAWLVKRNIIILDLVNEGKRTAIAARLQAFSQRIEVEQQQGL